MEISDVKKFFGVPVLIQLRFPICGVMVRSRGTLPYAEESEKSQWVPEPFLSPEGSHEGTQLMACAVIQPVNGGAPTTVEVTWTSIPAPPTAGQIIDTVATVGTLIDSKDIVAITRVVSVKEASALILPKP